VRLDEAHAAHVRREVEDEARAPRCLLAGRLFAQIELEVVDLGERLEPVVDGLQVDRARASVSATEEVGDEMAPDEAAAPGHHDEIVLVHGASSFSAYADGRPSHRRFTGPL